MSNQKPKSRQLDNISIISIDGKLLSKCSKKRAYWYEKKNLASLTYKDGEISEVRLNFKEDAKAVENTVAREYFSQTFKNICVVCGGEEELTAHHVFPVCFRYRIDSTLINDNISHTFFHDVLLVCEDCHHAYEKHAEKLKKELVDTTLVKRELEVIKLARVYVTYKELIPENKRELIISDIEEFLGNKVDSDILLRLADRHYSSPYEMYVKKFLTDPNDIDDFNIMWRKHFLEHAKPKFLPDGWNADFRIFESHLEKV